MKRVGLTPPRLVAAAAIIGAATAVILWVATYTTLTPLGRWREQGYGHLTPGTVLAVIKRYHATYTASPVWTTPVVALIGVAAIAAAALILRRRRTKLSD